MTRVILGAQMASRYDMSMGIHLFSLAIQEKVTIDKPIFSFAAFQQALQLHYDGGYFGEIAE